MGIYQIRTRLVADAVVGSLVEDKPWGQWLGGSSEQCTLLYGEPRDGLDIPFVGGYCPVGAPLLPDRFAARQLRLRLEDYRGMHFSTAPLDMVSSASVWCDEQSGFCRGVLFEYENGGLRTVGQCCLHVDLCKKYIRPSGLCFQTNTQDMQEHGIRVAFETGHSCHEQHPTDDGWQCKTLSGTLVFCFSKRRSFLFVETNVETSVQS